MEGEAPKKTSIEEADKITPPPLLPAVLSLNVTPVKAELEECRNIPPPKKPELPLNVTLTRVGQNKVCHKYKMLYKVVPQNQERWRKYPEQNWKHECPKAPNNLVGKDTRFKSHPKKVDRKSDNQSNKLDRTKCNGTKKYTEKAISDE